ncbi:FAD-dependent oxidoreductase [Streptomyces pathocidini]|uniref:FAD-dependent oxidoreductase n=1 Tax=Streptomyces pathocidini TaxID=1650571 RepID=A0ABW7UND7_9ACTN|nr:FAD-dependent monooxygenase [Streptomyces pathocidini]
MTHDRLACAVVIGSGICGLAAARVLSDHFERVVLVERDDLSGERGRRGVPQARHVHGLLARGGQHLEELFPGLRDELRSAGGPLFDHGEMAPTRVWAGAIPPVRSGVLAHAFSRDLLESRIRTRVVALPSVELRAGTAVEELHLEGGRVAGVRVRTAAADGEKGHSEVLEADLVVDASGRFSALPDWLEKAGFPRPRETVVDAGLAYATRTFTAPPQAYWGLQQINQAPEHPRGVYVAGVEQGRWIVTLFGAADDHPPADEEGWLEFARSLGNLHLDRLLDAATPEPGVHRFTRTQNRRVEYAALTRRPDRLIAIGDSVCAFNPVYGQGMTVSVLQTVALGRHLERARTRGLDGMARRYQREIARLIRLPWLMSTSEDLIWQHHREGKALPALLRASNWYKQRLLYLAVHDPEVFRLFLRVYHMLAPTAAMAGPRILAKVIFNGESPAAQRAVN